MISRVRVLAATGVVVLVTGGAFAAERTVVPRDRIVPGVRVEGFAIPDDVARLGDPAIATWLSGRLSPVLARSLEIKAGTSTRTITLRDALDDVDVLAIARAARRVGHEGPLSRRLDEALLARKGGVDLVVPLRAKTQAVEAVVAAMKGEVDAEPADAKLDLAAHGVLPDKEGRFLDLDGGVVSVSQAVAARAIDLLRRAPGSVDAAPVDPITLPVLAVPARITAASLAKLEIGEVVGAFETHFGRKGDQSPRATNIEVAAKKLDGLVLEPGQLVSFNAVVGERSEANGFKTAWEIFKGEMRPGVGGGTCQVASTFHAAAFFGGLEILERLPHSRPSAYIPMGLDSTVVYPVVDLKLKNPHPFPVVVHTIIGENTLKVELLGKEKPATVVFAREVVDTYPYVRKIDEEPWVKPGQAIKKQAGIRGYRVRRSRTLKYASGTSRTEVSYDFYPPTTEIFLVAPGTDPDELPALPKDVAEALAKKNGEPPPSPPATDAVACAGECGDAPAKPTVEVKNGAGVHDAVGDQLGSTKSLSIAH